MSAPLREFLVWVARCPRTYADAMEAWGTHCPRFTVWEDALAADLIQIATSALAGSQAAGGGSVTLTARGETLLAQR